MDITILGSTGSIGVQALEVAEKAGYNVVSLAARGGRIDLLENQARKFKPNYIAVYNDEAANDLKVKLSDTNIKVEAGEKAVLYAAQIKCDRVINAIVGIAGLMPTICAINAKNDIALANKETLVTGGNIVMPLLKKNKVKLYPVDSEHSAIFQSLQGVPEGTPFSIILTASGGPFLGKKKDFLKTVTPEMALKHPNWSMGRKITIDSATLMNKGLEVIEAVHLFNVTAKQIEVVVHRQSVIHSAVELIDGAVIAQLGSADMRIPIQYALTYPERMDCPAKRLSLTEMGALTFEKPDYDTFVCLKSCIEAINKGGLYPAAVNGANERAVALFLDGKIPFLKIGELISNILTQNYKCDTFSVQDVFEADKQARDFVDANI